MIIHAMIRTGPTACAPCAAAPQTSQQVSTLNGYGLHGEPVLSPGARFALAVAMLVGGTALGVGALLYASRR